MQNDDTDVIPLSEAAQILDLSVKTMHRRIASGAIRPAGKLPGLRGAYLFNRADIERLAKEHAA